MQRRLDKVCEEIEKACAEWDKLFEPQEIDQLQARVAELEASNKNSAGMVCEFAHYLDCPAYFLRPETEKTIIDIAAEERNRSMSEAKHTPGPWIVDTDYIIQDGGTSDENTIAIVGDQEEWKANAHLDCLLPLIYGRRLKIVA